MPNRKVDRASVLYNMMMMMMLFCLFVFVSVCFWFLLVSLRLFLLLFLCASANVIYYCWPLGEGLNGLCYY